MVEKEKNRFECTIYIVPLSSYGLCVCFRTSNIQNIPYKSNSYSFDNQKNSYFILGNNIRVYTKRSIDNVASGQHAVSDSLCDFRTFQTKRSFSLS